MATGNLNDLLAEFKASTSGIADSINDAVASGINDAIEKAEVINQRIIPKGLKLGLVSATDAQANTTSLRQTLAKSNRFSLLPDWLVQIDNDLRVANDTFIEGLGTPSHPTEISVVPGSPAVAARGAAKCWYSIIQSNTDPAGAEALIGPTYGLPIGSAQDVTIKNIILNAGYDEQKTASTGTIPTTCEAISIEGNGAHIENVSLKNTARGVEGGECFPIRIFAPELTVLTENRSSKISGCRLLSVGIAGASHNGGPGCEITFFSIVGSKLNIITNPIIENCLVNGIKRSNVQPSPLQVFHTAYCEGAEIKNNVVTNSDAVGYYQDTGSSIGTRIHGNRFTNIFRGIMLNAVTDFSMSDLFVTGNTIEIYRTKPAWNVNGTPAAVLLQKTDGTDTAFARCSFMGNSISAPSGNFGSQSFYSRGFYLELRNTGHAKQLVLANNLIDVPLAGTGVFYPIGWNSLLAIYVANSSAWNTAAPCLKAWGNKDSNGFAPGIIVTDAGYIPKLNVPQI